MSHIRVFLLVVSWFSRFSYPGFLVGIIQGFLVGRIRIFLCFVSSFSRWSYPGHIRGSLLDFLVGRNPGFSRASYPGFPVRRIRVFLWVESRIFLAKVWIRIRSISNPAPQPCAVYVEPPPLIPYFNLDTSRNQKVLNSIAVWFSIIKYFSFSVFGHNSQYTETESLLNIQAVFG